MSRKKTGVYTNNSYNVTRINGRKRYKSNTKSLTILDDNGNKSTITQNSNVDIDKRNNLFLSLFKVSLILIFGGYFFSNGASGFNNAQLLNTTNTEIISNNINGTNYEYRVYSSNYDYISKLNQLEALRNVFDLNAIETENEKELALLRVPNPNFFMVDGKYHDDSYIVGKMINDGVINLVQETFELDDKTYSYYYMHLEVLVVPQEYRYTYNNYVNSNNVISWVDYQKSILSDGNNWYDDVVYSFKLLNAPIIWVGNFVYDIGVIISFLVNW